jgi:autotransporter-associated beta strand protein
MASWLLVAGVLPAQAQTLTTMNLGGYLGVGYNPVADTYNAGYTMYVALLGRPQYAYYSPNFEASLEIGTWMGSTCNPGVYCDIEGGPGVGGAYGNHWCNHGFGIGAVAGDGFTNFVNGTSSGRGVGVYGAAQISPRLLYPPRLEMFRNGSKGQLVGYGYLALPLLPGKATTDGVSVPTGDHWWTLFFNTRNFQGPVAVLTPHFYSEVTKANTGAAGKMLDSCWAGPNKSIANESHYVPGKEYDGPEGSFFRVAPVFSAINHGTNGSIALASPTVYNQTALWNAAQQWFTNNGPAPVGPFNAQGAALQTLTGGTFGWGVQNSPLGSLPMAMGTTMGFYTPDSATYAYKWGTNQVSYTRFADGTPGAVMPEFYQLQAGVWTPVSAAAVPPQLASVSFDSGSPPAAPGLYTVPSDSVWTTPGPAAGPFQARIEDGNVVTYYWYRFADQPAIMKAGLTQAEREQLQTAVVKIHSAWTNGGTYLGPPTMGTLADVDPALLVTPPAGLEVGYVPIASNQFWGGWISFTWNQATSGKWSVASNWSSGSAPEAGGHSYYRLTFSPSGSCVATNDLSNGYGYGGYAANQLNFSGAVTLTGNPITLTADVGSYPQINQNSGNGVMINTPLNLDVSTTLGGTGSGLVVISNVITGPWHSLTLNNSGGATWRICGLAPNTYSGGTIIKSGTLIWGAVTNGVSPDCSYALGSGPVTLNSGATLQFEKASPTNALTLNGGTLYAANSAGVTWMGPVTVNSNTTVRTDFGMGISGNIGGARGLTKTGANTLTLNGVNIYTGANVVQAGTLSCSQPAALGAGALSISNGATVNLSYSGTRSIFSLTFGGTNKLAGVYGSTSSPATYQDAHFSGTGTVTVPVPLSITNLPATGITTSQATLNASLGLTLAYGGTNATVLAYWGTVNGGTNPAAWANSAYVGKWTNTVSANIAYTATGLALNTNTTYYFAFRATNAVYSVWATNVLSFTLPTKLAFTSVPVYPPAGFPCSVTVQAQDATGKPQNVIGATTVQLSKNSGSGTLSGTLSGTIANGSSSVVISGLVYSAADTMTLTATASSGMSLTAGVSPAITFMPPGLTWDANGTGAGVTDGGGAWINSNKTWWNGTTNLNWADNFNARFGSGGEGGTITLDTVTANLVTFTNFTGTYTLTSGPLTVVSNLTVANSAGSVVLGYVIGGTGGVTMDSSGSLRLYGLSPNTYSGGTIIKRGTLIWGTMVNGLSPDCNYALGTGLVTLNSGATLEFERVNAANALVLNGGTFWSQNGWGVTWSGPVTVNSNTTLRAQYRMEISGNISGAGGFTKTDGNTTTLSGANNYTGANVVQAGTLSCSLATSLGSGPLSISNGATVNLNYSGTRTISALTLGGTNMVPGVYGSTSSPATYKDSHFSGAGTVTVPALITITNTPATAITSSAAALNATLACSGTNAAVLAYWNTVNGGTNAATWTNSAYVGAWTNVVSTNLSRTVTGLAPNSTYYFAFRGTNAAGSVWATNVRSFTTLTPPAPGVANAPGATNLSAGVAQLRGTLTNGPADVRLYWGTSDGGTNKGNWANTNLLTGAGSGSFSTNVSNLLYGLTYYYRSYASNQWGTAWASATTNFTTLRPASSLANSAASGITTNAAALNATLACTGAVYQVSAFWNTPGGGTNATLWTNSAYVGSWTNVASTNLSLQVSGLIPSATYYFTFRATNALNTLWATNVQSLTTLAVLPPTPVLLGSAITISNGVPNFTFGTTAGYKYHLVYKNTLTDAFWLPVIAPPEFPPPDGWSATSTGAPMSLSDTNTADQPQRFYRLEAANP